MTIIQKLRENVKENYSYIMLFLYLVICAALIELDMIWIIVILTVGIIIYPFVFQKELIKTAYSYGQDQGNKIKATYTSNEIKEIKEVLKK